MKKLLIKEAKGKSKIVTIENHSIYGGLGSAVSEVIAENGISVPVKRIGVKEKIWTSRNSRIFTRGIWIDR